MNNSEDLTFAKLQAVNATRCAKWHTGREWSLAEWTNALCGEAGEAANIAKKILRIDTGMVGQFPENRATYCEYLADELADVVLYASLIADRLGVDLGIRVKEVFNRKSIQLNFPDRF